MNYNKKTVKDVEVSGKKVLLRCDFGADQMEAGAGGGAGAGDVPAVLGNLRFHQYDVQHFTEDSWLFFGKETAGLPLPFRERFREWRRRCGRCSRSSGESPVPPVRRAA